MPKEVFNKEPVGVKPTLDKVSKAILFLVRRVAEIFPGKIPPKEGQSASDDVRLPKK